MTEKTYHVVVGSYDTTTLVLHTDPDCTYLNGSETREVTKDVMPDREVCSRCRGTQKPSGGNWDTYRQAVEAGKNDD